MSKATELADDITPDTENVPDLKSLLDAASELRRLDRVNAQLLEALDFYGRNLLRRKSNGDLVVLTPIEHDCGDKARAAIAKATA